jgi:hypothetical protein
MGADHSSRDTCVLPSLMGDDINRDKKTSKVGEQVRSTRFGFAKSRSPFLELHIAIFRNVDPGSTWGKSLGRVLF